jgi:predicted nucleotide-binding protein
MIDQKEMQDYRDTRKVFLIHGHNEELINDVFLFLKELGLDPIVLQMMPHKGQTLLEKVEENSDVGFVVALLTCDDIGCKGVINEFIKYHEEKIDLTMEIVKLFLTYDIDNLETAHYYPTLRKENSLFFPKGFLKKVFQSFKPRARQNVWFEFGFFIGYLGRDRVAALYEEGVEIPSDLHGMGYILINDSWKDQLFNELEAAGMSINKKK